MTRMETEKMGDMPVLGLGILPVLVPFNEVPGGTYLQGIKIVPVMLPFFSKLRIDPEGLAGLYHVSEQFPADLKIHG